MRLLRVLPLLLTILLLWLLDHSLGALPALGRIIDPVNGALAAAEPADEDFNKSLHLKDLQAPVGVWLEDRLVPHVRAQNAHDLYYTQGYIHAYFRLWQMDIQTRAAGGRVSEVAGPKAIDFDRGQRRKGMVWGAQHSLAAMEAEPRTKAMLDAYRDGVNAYIHTLRFRSLPIEYKLMGFHPEEWTNIRTALLMKYMADDLSGKTDDIAYTILRDQLGREQFDFLFPERIKGSKPVIPEGTKFDAPSLAPPKYPGDSVWAHFNQEKVSAHQHSNTPTLQHSNIPTLQRSNEESGIGSNNWAISGSHTASGKPILCNDPHLGLNLPSLWFEMQLTAPGVNVYGASLPGAPGIVIGFNDKISWGFTNNYRDVKDFYEIKPFDNIKWQEVSPAGQKGLVDKWYEFNGKPVRFSRSIEVIGVKGASGVADTVLYTIHGPVMYDPSFPDPAKSGKLLACTWMAHRGTNELLAVYLLNRAGDYPAFTEAIRHFECPAQNFAYADGAGNIAMWGQGRFINKWKGQGRFVMEGRDSATLWGTDIPMEENPHVLNPPQGYVASANQQVTDSTYPYWYNGSFVEWRSWEINEMLAELNSQTSLKAASTKNQLSGWDSFYALPYSILYLDKMQNNAESFLRERLNKLLLILNPNHYPDLQDDVFPRLDLLATSLSATSFQIEWYFLNKNIWQDEFPSTATKWPSSERTVQLLLSDSTSEYYDDKKTQQVETLRDIVQRAFREAADSLNKLKRTTGLEWYKVKNTTLTHLAKIPAFSYDHLKIGGWSNTINATSGNHGPSWRMIVEMDSVPKAYVVYPGGQSGNPGSAHYSDYIQNWVEGKYFTAQFLTAATTKNPFKYTWTLTP